MTLNDAIRFLMENGYIVEHKGKLKFTNTYYKDAKSTDMGLTKTGQVIEPALVSLGIQRNERTLTPDIQAIPSYTQGDWIHFYIHFIKKCKAPEQLVDTRGMFYPGNKYSEVGMKAFQKAIKDGFRYDVLVMAVSLYYLSTVRLKKAIGSYMESGEWRTDYQTLFETAEESGIEGIKKHITKTRNQHGFDPYDAA